MKTHNLRERVQREIEHFEEIEATLADSRTADNPELLKKLSREHRQMEAKIALMRQFNTLLTQMQEVETLLSDPESDGEMRTLATEEFENLKREHASLKGEIEALLIPPDPGAGRNLIIEIRAGTGGEEAALFVADLYRMYLRFAEKQGVRIEVMSLNETGIGGFKEAIFSAEGERAYDLFHHEAGTHRVQRIPETESGGRIHTSAVTVAVLPEMDEEEVKIDEKELKIDVFRASGAGGQHVNKTESAVRILHIPSGIVVSCQDERSQHKNRAKAMRILRARLSEKLEQEQHEKDAKQKKEQIKSGDRSERIRTYNFPQGRITDHRIGLTLYNLAQFMNGEMDEMVDALLQNEKEEKIKALM